MVDPRDEEAREAFEGLPEDMRAPILDAARRSVGEFATPEQVYELAISLFREHLYDPTLNVIANAEEFFTKEERLKIYTEEEFRLSEQYPEGVPGMVLAKAIMQRMQQEQPGWYGER